MIIVKWVERYDVCLIRNLRRSFVSTITVAQYSIVDNRAELYRYVWTRDEQYIVS